MKFVLDLPNGMLHFSKLLLSKLIFFPKLKELDRP